MPNTPTRDRIESIRINATEDGAAITIVRLRFNGARLLPVYRRYRFITPASLRRVQRAQLAILADSQPDPAVAALDRYHYEQWRRS